MMITSLGSVFAMGVAPEGGSPWLQLVPFALVLGIFYFIILLPMKRKQQKVEEFQGGLKVGDRVITTGGIHGQVTRLGEQSVQWKFHARPLAAIRGRTPWSNRLAPRERSRQS